MIYKYKIPHTYSTNAILLEVGYLLLLLFVFLKEPMYFLYMIDRCNMTQRITFPCLSRIFLVSINLILCLFQHLAFRVLVIHRNVKF